uniref:Uncharacterized protein n=1 Tax=Junco hyemalis TaxID=40217 RepID=A0A8C5IYE1_JUNHY
MASSTRGGGSVPSSSPSPPSPAPLQARKRRQSRRGPRRPSSPSRASAAGSARHSPATAAATAPTGTAASARATSERHSQQRGSGSDSGDSRCPPRSVLDFDFEKLCSISLSHINVYACLVCGKYFQGESPLWGCWGQPGDGRDNGDTTGDTPVPSLVPGAMAVPVSPQAAG